jgi:hypothetical protein
MSTKLPPRPQKLQAALRAVLERDASVIRQRERAADGLMGEAVRSPHGAGRPVTTERPSVSPYAEPYSIGRHI